MARLKKSAAATRKRAPARRTAAAPAARGSQRSKSEAKAAVRPAASRPAAAEPAAAPLRTNRLSTYAPHPGVQMVQNWIATLKERTGRTIDEWMRHIRREGPPDQKGRCAWLKEKYGIGSNTAWWLAGRSAGNDTGLAEEDPAVYLANAVVHVEAMYPAARAALRPLHDELIRAAQALGADIRICPCQTIVPIFRRHVIAQVKPATRTRIDFGLALGDTPATGRLIDTGGFAKKDRITHRIAVERLEDIDQELRHWLRTAYDRNV